MRRVFRKIGEAIQEGTEFLEGFFPLSLPVMVMFAIMLLPYFLIVAVYVIGERIIKGDV